MPLQLTEGQRLGWYCKMYEGTKTRNWTMGSYNPTAATERLRLMLPMGKYMEDPGNNIPPVTCNCWEAVMLAAIEAGIYTKAQVRVALRPIPKVARTALIKYMYTNPDKEIGQGQRDPIDLPLSSIIMFGKDGSHFALSVGIETILHLDRGTQGLDSLSALRKNGYAGGSYYPMYVKRPPVIGVDLS